ncbi:sigma-70 family RNA polymerase sigma factor [Solihabitans fulvus]|uniref:Sigma-70 family RNA polymerase sigma factor n=2 Tax=Solihabitans fulvus TaxID=1892852 RepID=A0A5B2XPG9_9PSEU|nr:sigma-70 family RNA polymerase sigma factor [Solihabitans fulvus]
MAGAGDQDAWQELVRRHLGLVWSVARSFRLSENDAADVCQHTWLALVRHLDQLREPARLAAWLVTTAQRESLRALAAGVRETPVEQWTTPWDEESRPEDSVLTGERAAALWRLFTGLPERCQRILRFVAYSPELSYTEVADALGIPVGSLGPTRARCLAALRQRALTAGVLEEAVR